MKTTVGLVPRQVEGAPFEAAPPPKPAPRRPVIRPAVAWLAAAWVVPALTHVLGVDWLLPPLVVAATAGLLRGGRTLLDRLMLAVALLLGSACAAGLLFAVWPFGMAPVPVAGTALTVLGAISVLTGRQPRLPRPGAADVFTVGTALAVFAYMALPYLRTDATGRLALLMGGEDHARHVTIFDAVRRVGGYAYFQAPQQLPDLWEVLRYYPTGWHLTAGLLDGFARSSTTVGTPTSAIDHYVWLVLGSYGLFALALLWAAQWIAGPAVGPWRVPLVAFLAVRLGYGDLAILTILGFPSELFGLTALVLLAAVLSRPVRGVREQVLVVGAALVMLGFGYELFLPPAVVAVGVWALRRRRSLRRRPGFVVTAGTAAGALAVLPVAMGLLLGGHARLVFTPGGILPISRVMLLILGLVVVAAVVRPETRRLRVWRSYLWSLAAMLTLPAALLAHQVVTGIAAPYYGEKAMHGACAVLLAGLGLACVSLRPTVARTRWRAAPAEPLLAGLVAVIVVLSSGAVLKDTPWRPAHAEALSRYWHSGAPTRDNGPVATRLRDLARRYPPRPGTATVVLTGEFLSSYLETVYLSTLQRTAGITDDVLYDNGTFTLDPELLAGLLARAGRPILLIVAPAAEPLVTEVRRHRPELPISVVPLPG